MSMRHEVRRFIHSCLWPHHSTDMIPAIISAWAPNARSCERFHHSARWQLAGALSGSYDHFFGTFCSPFGNCSRYFRGENGFHLSFGWQKNAIFVWFTINMTALPAILSNHAKTLKHNKYKSLFFLFAVWGKLRFKWTLSVFVTHCQQSSSFLPSPSAQSGLFILS